EGEELDRVVVLRLLADPGGVDQREELALALDLDVEGVARRAGDARDDHALFLGQRVDQGRLAGVAPAHDREAEGGPRRLLDGLRRRQEARDLLLEVRDALAVLGADREGLAADPE